MITECVLFLIVLMLVNSTQASYLSAVRFDDNFQPRINFSKFYNFFKSCTVMCILTEDNDSFPDVLKPFIRNFVFLLSSFQNKSQIIKKCQCLVAVDIECSKVGGKVLSELPSVPTVLTSQYCQKNGLTLTNCDTTDEMNFSFCNRKENHKISNFGGSLMKVAIMDYKPFFIMQEGSTNHDFDGIEVHLVKEMAKQLNFTYQFLVYRNWGTALPNGSWKGEVMGSMQEGQADIAMANIWQLASLEPVMDFGPSLTKIREVFLVRRPEIMDFRWQTVLKIFKPQVWYYTVASSILITVMYWIGIRSVYSARAATWMGSLLTIFGFFIMTTSQSRVDEGNVRVLLTSWSIFAFLFTTSLSSGIVSSLTLPTFTPRVDSLRQLVDDKYFWTAQFYVNFMNNSDTQGALFDLKNHWVCLFEKNYKFLDEEEVKRKTGVDKKMVFFGQTYGNDLVILDTDGLFGHKGLNDYRVVKEHTSEHHVTFGVKKNSPLLEPLTHVTIWFLQNGLFKHWKDGVIRRWPEFNTGHLLVEEDTPTFGEPQPLQLSKLRPVFYFLLFGLLFSTFTFLAEMWW